jgi:hypothetical protein
LLRLLFSFLMKGGRVRMKMLWTLCFAVALAASSAFALAEDLKSGLEVGKSVPAYHVEKCAGGEDGVKVGDKLCYV